MIHDLPTLHCAYLDGVADPDAPTPEEHRRFLREVCGWRGVGDGLLEYLLHHGRMPPLARAAMSYAKRGWRVFPVAERSKEPHHQAGSWLATATTDPDTVQRWWRDHPHANIGLVCGGRLGVCIDVDRREALRELPEMPPTLAASTGSGGLHLFYRASKEYSNRTGSLPKGIDVRGDRGYIVAPPSVHPRGGIYHWQDWRAPAAMPEWLATMLAVEDVAPVPRTLPTVDRPDVLERARRYLAAIPGAISGQGGHAQTFQAAQALVRGFGLAEDVALGLLASEYNGRCDPPWSAKALRHKVASAARDGRMAWGSLLDR